MSTTPPRSPTPAPAARKLTIKTRMARSLLPYFMPPQTVEVDYDPEGRCSDVYDVCAKELKLDPKLVPLRIVEEHAPFVVGADDQSLLRAVNLSVRQCGVAEAGLSSTDPLKVVVHERKDGPVFLVDPKLNADHFTDGQLDDEKSARDVPCDAFQSLASIAVLPDADLHVEYNTFRSFEQMGGVFVVGAGGAFGAHGDDCRFVPLPVTASVDALKTVLETELGIPALLQLLVVGPKREHVADGAMELRAPELETARRLDFRTTAGAYWCIDTRDAELVKRGQQRQFFQPLGTYGNREFSINVQTLVGQTLTVPKLRLCDTIDTIKQHVLTTAGFPLDQQRLVFAGKCLNDGTATLFDCHLQAGSTLHMVLRLRGGMMSETSGKLNYQEIATLLADVHVYNACGEVIVKMPVDGGLSAKAAMEHVGRADDVDKHIDGLDDHTLRALAKKLLRDNKRKLDGAM
tara:strand:+ start:215 stop:1597 length:1383 start_codon:yes stop_codon:yes gene_type:complete